MMALNFKDPKHREMLMARSKNCTVRLGDVSANYPESSVVWITVGKPGETKEFLYRAFIDKVRVKTMGTLSSIDLEHQNPEISSREDLMKNFEDIYKRRITADEVVTVIYFTEISWDTYGR